MPSATRGAARAAVASATVPAGGFADGATSVGEVRATVAWVSAIIGAPWPAALRELREETNIRSVERIGEIADWLKYDIPRDLVGQAWQGKYRGQTQKWFAMRFLGAESEINVAHPDGAAAAEFAAWRWEPLQNVPDLVVPFKRAVYDRVAQEFRNLMK